MRLRLLTCLGLLLLVPLPTQAQTVKVGPKNFTERKRRRRVRPPPESLSVRIPGSATLRAALSLLLTEGRDHASVMDAAGTCLGTLTLSAIRDRVAPLREPATASGTDPSRS
jgi:hypothetical protein